MRTEIKIAVPLYKLLYSLAFLAILSLVRGITSVYEIGVALEAPVGALAAVFCSDAYLTEVQNKRRDVFRLYDGKKQANAVRKRLAVQMVYLTAASALGYALFYWQKPSEFGMEISQMRLFAEFLLAAAGAVFFWGMASVTICNLLQNQWAGIAAALVLWVVMDSKFGEAAFGDWGIFSYTFRDLEAPQDYGWLCGKLVCVLAGALCMAAVPLILKKRG